ncbi:hypothetical protein NBRC110019_15980 [Neptunitalea chrysea]|uniref:Outer membrane protein beta-barrel domain-containing protein n=1 Tax=Neptunitalea chrysea TaxID=1647581 RepID=A0A9W6B847_9FLAO|nr:hypothetical protein [Neptunitalea chrysea]GLB52558.1 hypothetical protein NBRC110019_15980 [Neptunitalea chrysea]
MKKTFLGLLMCLVTLAGYTQQSYTVNKERVTMQTEVEGALSLYVHKENNTYRYFVSKEGTFYELKNTQNQSAKYQFEYKEILRELTSDADISVNINRTTLTLTSIKKVVIAYNKAKDSNYVYTNIHFQMGYRLGVMGGVSNNVYTYNPNNVMAPQITAELEVYNKLAPASGHSAFVHVRHNFTATDYDYSATQLSINYRYKVVNNETFKLYGQCKIATFGYKSFTKAYAIEDGGIITFDEDGFDLDIPVIFGVGADIKLSDNMFVTLQYTDIVAMFYDANDEFPVDVNLGLKFTL